MADNLDLDEVQRRLLRKAGEFRRLAKVCLKELKDTGATARDRQGWHIQYRNHMKIALEYEETAISIDRHVGKKAIEPYESMADTLDSRVKSLHGGRPRRKPAPEPH